MNHRAIRLELAWRRAVDLNEYHCEVREVKEYKCNVKDVGAEGTHPLSPQ